MGRNLRQLLQSDSIADDDDDRWLLFQPGIVADNDDPENQHRVRLIVPSIDEDRIFDKWAQQMIPAVGSAGYGSFFPPALGSEVVVCGRGGEKHSLYYMSVYNENYIVPPDYRSLAHAGIRVPGQLKLIADQLMQLRGSRVRIEADASIKVTAPGGFFVNDRAV